MDVDDVAATPSATTRGEQEEGDAYTPFRIHERVFIPRSDELLVEVTRSRQLMMWSVMADKQFMREYVDLSSFEIEVLKRQLFAVIGYAYGQFDYLDYLLIRDNFAQVNRLFANSLFTARFTELQFEQLRNVLSQSSLLDSTVELFSELTTYNVKKDDTVDLAMMGMLDNADDDYDVPLLSYAKIGPRMLYRVRANKPYNTACSAFLVNAPTYVMNINTIKYGDRITNVCGDNIRDFEEFAFESRVISRLDEHDSFVSYFTHNAVYYAQAVALSDDEVDSYFADVGQNASTDEMPYRLDEQNDVTMLYWQLQLARLLYECRVSGKILFDSRLSDDDATAIGVNPSAEQLDEIALLAFVSNSVDTLDTRTNERVALDTSFVPRYNTTRLRLCVLDKHRQKRRRREPNESSATATTTTPENTTRLQDYEVKNVYDEIAESALAGITLLASNDSLRRYNHNNDDDDDDNGHIDKLMSIGAKSRAETLPICTSRTCDRLAILETRTNVHDAIVMRQTDDNGRSRRRNIPTDEELIEYYEKLDVRATKKIDASYRSIFYTFPFKSGHYVNASTGRIVYVDTIDGLAFVPESLNEALSLIYYNWSSENLYATLEEAAKRIPYDKVLAMALNATKLDVLAALLMLIHAQMGAKISISVLATNDGHGHTIEQKITVRIPYINELYRWIKIQCGGGDNAECSVYSRMTKLGWTTPEDRATPTKRPNSKHWQLARVSFPHVTQDCKNTQFYQKQLTYFYELVRYIASHVYSSFDCVFRCSRYSIPEYLYHDLHEAVVTVRELYVLLTIIVQDTNYELYRAYRSNVYVNWSLNVDGYAKTTRNIVTRTQFGAVVEPRKNPAEEAPADEWDYRFPANARVQDVASVPQREAEFNVTPILLPVELDSRNDMCVVQKNDFYAYRFADDRLERLVLDGNIIHAITKDEQCVLIAQLYNTWKK